MERHSISKGGEAQMPKQRKPKTTQRYSNIGVLDLPTGYLEIHDGVINFLKKKVGRRTDTEGGRRTVSFTKKEIIEQALRLRPHAGRSTCKRNPCREAGIAVEEKGRNRSLWIAPVSEASRACLRGRPPPRKITPPSTWQSPACRTGARGSIRGSGGGGPPR